MNRRNVLLLGAFVTGSAFTLLLMLLLAIPAQSMSAAIQSVSINKTVNPEADVPYHGTVTYTVTILNTGTEDDADIVFTDTLPAEVDFGGWIERPPSAAESGEMPSLLAGEQRRQHGASQCGDVEPQALTLDQALDD